MVSASNLLSLALLYVGLLFAVAWYVDRNSARVARLRDTSLGGVVYALTLAVYCSSWTFYGAVGSATESAWSHAPIYLGPILVFLFGWPLIQRLLAVGARHRVTSIADFIGARFGKRQSLAVVVTLVASAAVLPYIALQFKALAQAWAIVGGSFDEVEAIGGDTALLTAIILAVFTILFGTRRLDGRERHQGVMSAIAVESLVKLMAFVAVAVLAMDYLWRAPPQPEALQHSDALGDFDLSADFLARTLISGLAILCLPRQFHVMVVEASEHSRPGIARWLFPVYLALFMVLVVPISLAGSQIFVVSGINPDTYVQMLPIALESNFVTVAAFIGGISAATGMVIVATVSLAIMITNEVVAPLVMRLNDSSPSAVLKLGDNLRRIRQITIAAILFAAWLVTRQLMGIPWLAQIGFISFLAAAQLAPAVIAGLYWRGASGGAVFCGLVVGLGLWFYCGLLPAILPATAPLVEQGPWGVEWLRPLHLFGVEGQSRLAYATAWSLGLNAAVTLVLSLLVKPSAADARQAQLFIDGTASGQGGSSADFDSDFDLSLIRVSQLQGLLEPFVDAAQMGRMWREFEDVNQQRLLPADRAPRFMVNRTESVLASVIGATSAHKAMEQLENTQQLAFSDLAGMVADASRLHTFNRELLQTTVESLSQGVCVVDSELRVVAWNSRYEELFDYPPRLLYVGCPIERIYRFNARRGVLSPGGGSVDQEIEKRLRLMRAGSQHSLERTLPNGTVIAIHGTPMPNGGFVTTYVDITDYRHMVAQLEETREELEAELASGSRSLAETNAMLRQENRLRAQMESRLRDAHQSKSRFMSATSHDLLQPINAARLLTAALGTRLQQSGSQTLETVAQIDGALRRAEELIAELREIARLDSGRQSPNPAHFHLPDMFTAIRDEFGGLAAEAGLDLRVVSPDVWVQTDQALLYRVLQNLVGNALRYTHHGGVLVCARRRGANVLLQVWDTGPGIAPEDQVRVFEEFERGQQQGGDADKGLGLGLSIVQRISELLGLDLQLHARAGRGTVFSLSVPLGEPQERAPEGVHESGDLQGISVLCLDNDALILQGLEQLLLSMGANVTTARNREELSSALAAGAQPQVLLVDYQLDDGDNGIAAVRHVLGRGDGLPPCILVSANDSDDVREEARDAGFRFLPKPVNAARLRALILALCRA